MSTIESYPFAICCALHPRVQHPPLLDGHALPRHSTREEFYLNRSFITDKRPSDRNSLRLSDRTNSILLNTELLRAPSYCIDYVIAHELCHLRHRDHGSKFQRLLTRMMPDWRERKARLERVTGRLGNGEDEERYFSSEAYLAYKSQEMVARSAKRS